MRKWTVTFQVVNAIAAVFFLGVSIACVWQHDIFNACVNMGWGLICTFWVAASIADRGLMGRSV